MDGDRPSVRRPTDDDEQEHMTMATRPYETLLVDVDDGVATLTFNRPDKMNAFNAAMTVEFTDAMWALDADEAVRVIVVTGAGRAFCSGVDLEAGADVFGSEAHGQTEAEKEGGGRARGVAPGAAGRATRTAGVRTLH